MRHEESGGNSANLYFNSPVSGKCNLKVEIVGENGAEVVEINLDGKTVTEFEVDLFKGERANVEVLFAKKVNHLAIEASLSELEISSET